jgi:mannitol-specific phosphotransferase system IIBC component
MNPIVAGLAIALLASLIGNAWLFSTVMAQSEEIGAAQEQAENAKGAASACSKGVDELKTKAKKQAEAARVALKAAHDAATQAGRRADTERSRPQAVPGDACASAEVETRDWLAGRR